MKLADFFVKIGVKVDQAQIDAAKAGFDKVSGVVKGFAKGAATVGVVALGAALGLESLVTSTAENSAEIQKLSTVLGISAEKAQEWAFAFNKTGVSVNDFTELAAELAENVGEAAGGTGEAADAFTSLGIDTKDASGKLKEVDVLLLEIATSFSGMADGQKKTAATTGLFGESGLKLLPTLNKGAKGIEEFRQQARDLGIVLDGEAIAKNAEFASQLKDLGAIFQALKVHAISPIIEVLNQMGKEFIAWFKINKDIVKLEIKEFFSDLVDLIKALILIFKAFLFLFKAANTTLKFVIRTIKVLYLALANIGKVIYAIVAPAIGLVVSLLGGSLSKALLAGIALFVVWNSAILLGFAALAATVLIVDDFLVLLAGGDSIIGRLFSGLKNTLQQWVNEPSQGSWFIDGLKSAIGFILKIDVHFATFLTGIKNGFIGLFDYLDAAFVGIMNTIIDGLNYTLSFIPGNVLGSVTKLKTGKEKAQDAAITQENTFKENVKKQAQDVRETTQYQDSQARYLAGGKLDFSALTDAPKGEGLHPSWANKKGAPAVNTANVTINGSGLSAEQLTKSVGDAFSDFFGPTLRQTKAGIK